ncbi:MAG: damage-inducible protein DinB [Anaerolineae bacterium]|nr:damage-inducible protein DinB [Gemmatimonadaceae bacterium]
MARDTSSPSLVITPEELLSHWQGHRNVTRRVIEAFPEDKLFQFSIGAMRPFSVLAMEFIKMAVPTLRGVISGEWSSADEIAEPATRADLLRLWDETTQEINRLWPEIPPNRFQQIDKAFGQWEMPIYGLLFYVIDNEIHHRGQGYVYLRSLGIEPPPFYDRA